jgi:hypothetical protein
MTKDGLVREVEEPATASLRLARTKHFITAEGHRAYREFLAEHREMALTLNTAPDDSETKAA